MSTSCNYIHSPFYPNHLREMGADLTTLDEDQAIAQILGPTLTVPPRVFTLCELETYYNGQNGAPSYVSANGIVFDVTNSPAWVTGTHFSLTPGHDYSSYFTLYHSNDLVEFSTYVPVVGSIIYPHQQSTD